MYDLYNNSFVSKTSFIVCFILKLIQILTDSVLIFVTLKVNFHQSSLVVELVQNLLKIKNLTSNEVQF